MKIGPPARYPKRYTCGLKLTEREARATAASLKRRKAAVWIERAPSGRAFRVCQSVRTAKPVTWPARYAGPGPNVVARKRRRR